MTVAPAFTETSYALIGAGIGPFATVWPYAVAADVSAFLDLGAGDVALVQGVDYTLIGNNPLGVGGRVTLSAGLVPGGGWPDGAMLSLVRATSCDQPSAFGDALGFSPQDAEAALDHLSRQIQELWTSARRSLQLPLGEAAPDWPPAADRIGLILLGDAQGVPRWVSTAAVAIDFTSLSDFPNDAAAAAGGIDVGQPYRNGSVIQVRVT